jgi:hypothetical protein
MKYGYARVSTDDQTPALLRCLKKLEHGDTLIVWKLDRLLSMASVSDRNFTPRSRRSSSMVMRSRKLRPTKPRPAAPCGR